jgi:hypothetical protein
MAVSLPTRTDSLLWSFVGNTIVRQVSMCANWICLFANRSSRSNYAMQRSALFVTPLENPRVGGSIPPLATTFTSMNRKRFPASPVDYWFGTTRRPLMEST